MESKLEQFDSEKDYSYEPISCRFENKTGIFHIQEDKNGLLLLEVENKDGTRISLNDLIPAGYKIIGNKLLATDPEYRGMFNTDTSMVDPENRVIIASEQEIKKEGWKYILTLLHEIGHAVRNEEDPEARERLDKSSEPFFPDADINKVRIHEALTAENERWAWAFALKKMRALGDGLNVEGRIYKDMKDLKDFIIDDSLGAKVKYINQAIKKFEAPHLNISEEEKEKLRNELAEDVAQYYLHGDKEKFNWKET